MIGDLFGEFFGTGPVAPESVARKVLGINTESPLTEAGIRAVGSSSPPSGKSCARCRRWLPFAAFRPNRKLVSGWSSWCRECQVDAARRWRAENPEKVEAANQRRRTLPVKRRCAECGEPFAGRKNQLLCGSRRCKDARYARAHPDVVRAKRARKARRRRERAREQPVT